jgi:predicted DsbA family dithiol-disulfide isomerase
LPQAPLPVTLFSDFTCPYSLVTEAALRALASERDLAVTHRAFELYPAPAALAAPGSDPGLTAVLPLAAELGIELRDPGFRPRTRKAHEAARFAAEHAAEEALRAVIQLAYWRDGLDIGRIDVLSELAPAAGLDALDLRIALDIDRYAEDVERDERLAARLGVTAVPTIFLGLGPSARVLVGAQSPSALDAALRDL